VEFEIDLEAALNTLTGLQRYCFVEICLNGRTYREIADERGKSLGTVTDAVRAAKEKIKKFF
jgi:DNA-directed RNA polymerase specialized sigma24 family protein